MRYAVFLRGVNVGGVALTNARLTNIARAAGFDHARALMSSGNLLLASPQSPEEIKRALEQALAAACGQPVPCFVRSLEQLKALLSQGAAAPPGFHHYLLFADQPVWEALRAAYEALPREPQEALSAHGRNGHWVVRRGNTLGAFGSRVLGRAFRDRLTSRSARTVQKAVDALDAPGFADMDP